MTSNLSEIEECFRTHRSSLLGFCRRMLGSQAQAEDVVQEIFLQACASDQPLVLPAWLYRSARHRCIDLHRKRGVWEKIKSLVAQPTANGSFDSEVIDRDLGWRVLRRLPEKMRAALLLKSYAGFSYQEIGDILELTPGSVGVLLSRARRRACEIMEKESL